MNPSKLNKRITIQKKVGSKPLEDDQYTDFKKVWAGVSNIHGKESIDAQKVNPYISKKVTIRYIKDLDPSINKFTNEDYRVVYNNQIYNILYIDNIREENRYMELLLEVI